MIFCSDEQSYIMPDGIVIFSYCESDIIFASKTARRAISLGFRRISLRSNITRRKANITEKDKFLSKLVFFLARLKGFEPPFFRIGICCVIQLRHRRILSSINYIRLIRIKQPNFLDFAINKAVDG